MGKKEWTTPEIVVLDVNEGTESGGKSKPLPGDSELLVS